MALKEPKKIGSIRFDYGMVKLYPNSFSIGFNIDYYKGLDVIVSLGIVSFYLEVWKHNVY